MNYWQELEIENKITQILQDIPDAASVHHLGKPFLTAYQIAIEFANRYPEEFKQLELEIGGVGTGKRNSLAQYLAGQLSKRIKNKEIAHVEGGFLSNQHLHDINFHVEGQQELIHSSLTNTNFTLSMFRLKSEEAIEETGGNLQQLENELTQELRGTYEAARERNYVPTYFLQMLEQYGGKETARRLLAKEEIQQGLITLAEKGMLKDSLEAVVLKEKYKPVFKSLAEADEIDYLAEARRRLEELGYEQEGKSDV
jgi:hypothetical protein